MDVAKIKSEIADIKKEIQLHANACGMSVDAFMDSLDCVDSCVAEAIVPLLIRKIELLKIQWNLEVKGDQDNNLILFSRTR